MNTHLPSNLKYLRKKRGLNTQNIADMFGYKTYTTIVKWENGITQPSIEQILKLADFYNVEIEDLISIDLYNKENFVGTNKLIDYPNEFIEHKLTEAKAYLLQNHKLLLNKSKIDINKLNNQDIIKLANFLKSYESATQRALECLFITDS